MPTEQEAVLHNLQAEKTVLGALLLDPQAMLRVSPLLTAEDFYDPVHGAVFASIDRLHRDRVAIDPVTVADQLAEHTLFHSIGGAAFLAGLVADTPTASHVTSYAEIVREKSNLRALQAIATDIKARGAKGDLPYAEQLASSHEALLALERQRDTHAPQHIATVSSERYDVHAEVREGGDAERKRRLLSGFKNLDYYFGGFAPTSYSIIAGRPGMGKTALMLNMAYNAAQRMRNGSCSSRLRCPRSSLSIGSSLPSCESPSGKWSEAISPTKKCLNTANWPIVWRRFRSSSTTTPIRRSRI